MEQIYNNLGEVCPGVRMLDESQVALLFSLHKRGWSVKAISKEWGWSRNTIRGWLDRGLPTVRPVMGRPRKLAKEERYLHNEFNGGVHNADVLRQQLAAKGVEVGLRTVERAVETWRQEHRAAEAATLRFETDPGEQLQIDFGEKWIVVGGARVKAFVFVATLGYSRRTFARIYPAMRQQHWLEGLEAAMQHFGGATKECLVDNAKALVIHWKDDEPHYHPEFKAFCEHWGMRPRACRPYRPRTKGKVESGVKYVKGNALGRLAYTSWDALHAHLDWWMAEIADARIHGTTQERPIDRFEREAAELLPLGNHASYLKVRRLIRKVTSDCRVELDTNRYSIPFELVGQSVNLEVVCGEMTVLWRGKLVAEHDILPGRFGTIQVPSHLEGLVRKTHNMPGPNELERSLQDYTLAVGE